MLTLVIGGAASGKSQYAERFAAALGSPAAYCATLHAQDTESLARVQRHRAQRAGLPFDTVECPLRIPRELGDGRYTTALLECLSTFLANAMFSLSMDADAAVRYLLAEINFLRGCTRHLVVVSNDVFADTGRYNAQTTAYIAALGALNRHLAAQAHIAVEVVCGIPLYHKGKELAGAYEAFV